MKIEFGQSISRTKFISYVVERLGGAVETAHIQSVVSILLDDLSEYLLDGNPLEVTNLGTLSLKQYGPRKHHNLQTKAFEIAPGNNRFYFKISYALRRFVAKHLDTEKTYGAEFEERRSATEGIDASVNPFWLKKPRSKP